MVGYGGSRTPHTLIERWNGTDWAVQPSPDPGGSRGDDELVGVAALSPTDAWAVGDSMTKLFPRTLIERWDGTAWKIQPSPNPGRGTSGADLLAAVAALSPTDAWAVGTYNKHDHWQTLVEHWNGKAWQVQACPNPSPTLDRLYGVTAVSATNAWAVGALPQG